MIDDYNDYTENIARSLKPVDQFDAIFFHQRSLDFTDVPSKRNVSKVSRYLEYNHLYLNP